MRQYKLEFINDGFKEILNSEGVKAMLEQQASIIQSRAEANAPGAGFSHWTWRGNYGGGRYVASVASAGAQVFTKDYAAQLYEVNEKALSRAVY